MTLPRLTSRWVAGTGRTTRFVGTGRTTRVVDSGRATRVVSTAHRPVRRHGERHPVCRRRAPPGLSARGAPPGLLVGPGPWAWETLAIEKWAGMARPSWSAGRGIEARPLWAGWRGSGVLAVGCRAEALGGGVLGRGVGRWGVGGGVGNASMGCREGVKIAGVGAVGWLCLGGRGMQCPILAACSITDTHGPAAPRPGRARTSRCGGIQDQTAKRLRAGVRRGWTGGGYGGWPRI